MKTCTCGQPVDGKKHLCRHCWSHYMRQLYQNNKSAKKKQIARVMAYRRLEAGIIIKEPCRLCGSEDVQMHHPDYSKPHDVVWLCVPCHNEMHVLERKVMAA